MLLDNPKLKIAVYANTPENAKQVGWLNYPEYLSGDSTAVYVIHDYGRGVFVYSNNINHVP